MRKFLEFKTLENPKQKTQDPKFRSKILVRPKLKSPKFADALPSNHRNTNGTTALLLPRRSGGALAARGCACTCGQSAANVAKKYGQAVVYPSTAVVAGGGNKRPASATSRGGDNSQQSLMKKHPLDSGFSSGRYSTSNLQYAFL